MYMLLHRSDLHIPAKFRQFLGVFNFIITKSLHFSKFFTTFADFNEICSDFLENAEKRCNFSKLLNFNLLNLYHEYTRYLFNFLFNVRFNFRFNFRFNLR